MAEEGAAELPRLLPHDRQRGCARQYSSDRDTATSRAICFNPDAMGGESGQINFVGIWYVDEFVRTAEGWRISKRVEEKCFDKLV